ncbi:MAG: redoxin domain-containing protein [Chitinophagaceae bacterium]|jgi:hypothetical protein|nr:redoxin domain-containing protein [Chitinophagaceae bacterium]
MKKLIGLVSMCLIAFLSQAQVAADNKAPYLKDKRLPAFQILQADSTWFTHQQLPKADFTILIYFSPDCSHCQHEASEMMKVMDSLKKTTIVWVSYRDLNDIRDFAISYGFDKYSNIKVGRDPNYTIPSFFQVKFTPYVAVYDKNKQYIKSYETGVEMPELLTLLKKYK